MGYGMKKARFIFYYFAALVENVVGLFLFILYFY
jgi:hypothetical protein